MKGKTATANRVLIIPCSGIGKAYGSIGREATYVVIEELRPDQTDAICLSLLTLQDRESQRQVQEHATITIDGCPKACAKVNVEKSGAIPAATFRVIDTYREHRELRAGTVTDIGENGHKLARILAEKIVSKVDEINNGHQEE